MAEDIKRLFFGAAVSGPWPEALPSGRVLDAINRHMTLAFLGATSFSKLQAVLSSFPPPDFQVGDVGVFDKQLFLPSKRPRVVAWHAKLLGQANILNFQKELAAWLKVQGYELERRAFLPHVTIARSPFAVSHWKKSFEPLALKITGIHLYESVGNLAYESRWRHDFTDPIEEIPHTADRAFRVCAQSMAQLHINAQVALSFVFPPIIDYFSPQMRFESLDDIIVDLNHVIARADKELGCPIKAVSFHGQIQKLHLGVLSWEMIIDV